MDSTDFLKMKLEDISDYFLSELIESENNCIKAELPGCNGIGERFVLRVCLCKGDGLDE